MEERGLHLPPSGIPIYYHLCDACGFLFAPEFATWTQDDFAQRVYNDLYLEIDPDFREVRPRINAEGLIKMFPDPRGIRHLDFGGGEGFLSRRLRDAGWDSRTYDPYAGSGEPLPPGARFDLITSFEVFEHVPDPLRLMRDLDSLLADYGVLMFSTMLSDDHVRRPRRIDWWYIAPRNGHISIYARKSLDHLAARFGFRYRSPAPIPDLHFFWRREAPWARHILQRL